MHFFMITMPGPSPRRASGLDKLLSTGLRFEIVDGVEARNWRTDALPVDPAAVKKMSPAEIGCYLAHLRALHRIIDYRLPWACILEDDFCFEADPDFGLAEIEAHLPPDFDYIHLQRPLDWNPKYRILERCGAYERILETPLGATGYIITRRLAEHVLSAHSLCGLPIDELYCRLSYSAVFYKPVKPLVGIQVGLFSVIHEGKLYVEGEPA